MAPANEGTGHKDNVWTACRTLGGHARNGRLTDRQTPHPHAASVRQRPTGLSPPSASSPSALAAAVPEGRVRFPFAKPTEMGRPPAAFVGQDDTT